MNVRINGFNCVEVRVGLVLAGLARCSCCGSCSSRRSPGSSCRGRRGSCSSLLLQSLCAFGRGRHELRQLGVVPCVLLVAGVLHGILYELGVQCRLMRWCEAEAQVWNAGVPSAGHRPNTIGCGKVNHGNQLVGVDELRREGCRAGMPEDLEGSATISMSCIAHPQGETNLMTTRCGNL